MTSQPLLSVRHLTTEFLLADKQAARALENVSFDVMPGQTIGLVGESGCGKTTTLMSIMRLLPASGRIISGNVFFKGTDLLGLSEREMRARRWKDMSIVFQGAMNALNPVMKIGDQVCEAILLHNLMPRQAAEQRVGELLETVGIPATRRDQYPHQYSGGMRQRAMIAMALACSPELLFADEPTTALDVMIQAQVLELLKKIQKDLGLAIVLVTHDLGVIAEMCDVVVVMYGGKVAEYGPAELVYNQPQHPYTQRLLEAFPDLSRSIEPSATGSTPGLPEERQELATIPGTPPRLNALPPGCRFSPRCHKSIEICTQIAPNLVDMAAPGSGMRHLAACHLLSGTEVSDL
jgi:peptide/nickel transport system ATP-binding protein